MQVQTSRGFILKILGRPEPIRLSQHLPDLGVLREYLKTTARVLKPGGTLIFTTTPRTWRDSPAFALRARRWLLERRSSQGPRGLYRNQWYGIRPTLQEIGVCDRSKRKISSSTETNGCSSEPDELLNSMRRAVAAISA